MNLFPSSWRNVEKRRTLFSPSERANLYHWKHMIGLSKELNRVRISLSLEDGNRSTFQKCYVLQLF
jgi:hypothetical protein